MRRSPIRSGRRKRKGVTAIAVAAVLATATLSLAACEPSPSSPAPSPPASSVPPVSSSASPPPSAEPEPFVVRLGHLRGTGVQGRLRPATLKPAVAAVRATMTELYSIGFVDPTRWGGGGFPSLFRSFAPEARAPASEDLGALTLGPTASLLDAVRPRIARLDVHVVADERDRPVAAFATMRFKAIGLSGGTRLPIRHDGAYVLRRSEAGWRITAYDVASRVPSPGEVDRMVREARLAPAIPSVDPMFILVIGSDARPGADPSRGLADSLHIVGVNPREGVASIVGIPRDSLVPIPGFGTDKINAALARGGPDLVVETVERLSGVQIDAYLLTGFAGFERLVETIGPIGIQIPYPMDDRSSHARFRAGRTELSARQALAFSRDRHDALGGDFGRSLNQGRLLVAALTELREDLRRGDLALLPWLLAGARHLETDLDLGQMADLLLSVPAIAPDEVRNRVVPGRTATIGGRSVVLLDPGAMVMFRDLARDGILGG